jgi:AcrR family transcriptional regulator
MVISAALLIRERGAAATSVADVLEHSGAPRGSAYHYFPGGRGQLLREATDYAAGFLAERLERAGSAVEVFDALYKRYRRVVVDSDFRAGCPVVAVTVESDEAELHDHANAAFGRWRDILAERIEADGVAAEPACELAVLIIASVEGALVLARAQHDVEPYDVVYRRLRALLETELEGA